MRVLIIYCNPVSESFAAAAHATVLQALAEAGHEVTDVDLYAKGFVPVMSRQERLDYQNTTRNIRPVRKYDDQLALGAGDRADLPGLDARYAGSAEGLFRSRVGARRRVRFGDGRTHPHGPVEEHQSHRRGHHLCGILLGDPARKVVARGLRTLCARDCRVDWLAHYNMDSATPKQLRRFLGLVRQRIVQL